MLGCDNVAQAPLPAASALIPTLVLRHRVTNREQVSRRVSDLLTPWNVCEPRTWRGHSCLPRRDSSRRFSERSEKPPAARESHPRPIPHCRRRGKYAQAKSVDTSVDAAGRIARATNTATTSGVQSLGTAGISAGISACATSDGGVWHI